MERSSLGYVPIAQGIHLELKVVLAAKSVASGKLPIAISMLGKYQLNNSQLPKYSPKPQIQLALPSAFFTYCKLDGHCMQSFLSADEV